MFDRYQNPASSAAKWIFFGFFGILLIVFLFGANIKDAIWLNPDIAAAQARQINIENAHQQATYALQERLATAQTEAEIQQIQREQGLLDAQYQHDIQALAQDLAHREVAFKTWMAIFTILGVALGIALIVGTILWVGAKALVNVSFDPTFDKPTPKTIPPVEKTISPLPERQPYDPWTSPVYRRRKRVAARKEERKQRKEKVVVVARKKVPSDNSARMNKKDYHKRPLAGD
jgi:hypothetical protein